MTTYRNRLSGNESTQRTINEAIRKLQELTDRIFHGVSASNLEWSPEASGGVNLGSTGRNWGNVYISGSVVGANYWAHALCGGI